MSNPPNGEYRKKFVAGEKAFTADKVLIEEGLRVFTNNLDRGVIDLSRAEWEWYPSENKYHLWFNVTIDLTWEGKGVATHRSVMQSDDRVATRFEGEKA